MGADTTGWIWVGPPLSLPQEKKVGFVCLWPTFTIHPPPISSRSFFAPEILITFLSHSSIKWLDDLPRLSFLSRCLFTQAAYLYKIAAENGFCHY